MFLSIVHFTLTRQNCQATAFSVCIPALDLHVALYVYCTLRGLKTEALKAEILVSLKAGETGLSMADKCPQIKLGINLHLYSYSIQSATDQMGPAHAGEVMCFSQPMWTLSNLEHPSRYSQT